MRTLHVVSFAASVADETKSWTHTPSPHGHPSFHLQGVPSHARFHHSTLDIFYILIHSAQILTCVTIVTCPLHIHTQPKGLGIWICLQKAGQIIPKSAVLLMGSFLMSKTSYKQMHMQPTIAQGSLSSCISHIAVLLHTHQGSHKWQSTATSLLTRNSRYLGMANGDRRLGLSFHACELLDGLQRTALFCVCDQP